VVANKVVKNKGGNSLSKPQILYINKFSKLLIFTNNIIRDQIASLLYCKNILEGRKILVKSLL
jgi:hypothetical protein